jgi:CRP/FNR family transcriptional regulator
METSFKQQSEGYHFGMKMRFGSTSGYFIVILAHNKGVTLVDQQLELDPKEYMPTLALLKQIDFFQTVPEAELKSILFSLQKQNFPPNKTILFQGEIANRLFIIRSGMVSITTKSKGQKLSLAELKAGMYFGEISLLRPMSATATATAGAEGADLVILTHEAMATISKKIPDIQQRIQKVIDIRLASKQKAKETDEKTDDQPAEPKK